MPPATENNSIMEPTVTCQVFYFVAQTLWNLVLLVHRFLLRFSRFSRRFTWAPDPCKVGIAAGKTVLVTTGRQAKSLHTVRALKQVGARVIVTDYEKISSSAVSTSCDDYEVLPDVNNTPVDEWITHFRDVLVRHSVDYVIPASTINEVLVLGLAQDRLSVELPLVRWICPNLEQAIHLDDRTLFSQQCVAFGVPSPDSGILHSAKEIPIISKKFKNGIILKRIESSVNRSEEIVHIKPGQEIPSFIQPTSTDAWQWQRFVRGAEYSIWYICINGQVTFSGCYHSEADLVHFDPAPIPTELDIPLRRLISGLKLSGQYAFDFITEVESDAPYVIECNPRCSSVLETVSQTPMWGEAFFGVDVTHRTVLGSVGFVFHRNCWPWASRKEGYFSLTDPLPLIAAEFLWPLNAISVKAKSFSAYKKIDVNICKIILNGPSPGRGVSFFTDELMKLKIQFLENSIRNVDTVLLDITVPQAVQIAKRAKENGVKVIPFQYGEPTNNYDNAFSKVERMPVADLSNSFFAQFIDGETRAVFGSELSNVVGAFSSLSYRIVTKDDTLRPTAELPLRRRRILHLIGSCVSEFYDGVSLYYGKSCISSIKSLDRFDHVVAYIHINGEWSVEKVVDPQADVDFIKENAPRMAIGAAIEKIGKMKMDVVLPHLFDYDGMTVYRSLFDVLLVPVMGSSGDALALSTNKARTNAIAAAAGVPTPMSEILRAGEVPKNLSAPFIVKPVEEDNSLGVVLVRNNSELDESLKKVLEFDSRVLCEQFIPLGRELRIAVLEKTNGELEMLPAAEYILSEEEPIRCVQNKLNLNSNGKPTSPVKVERRIPAELDEKLKSRLYNAAVKAHSSLGCRDYSIYDVRVNPEGEPFVLESCLYCSFASTSILVLMAEAKGTSIHRLFELSVEQAISRRVLKTNTAQRSGMKLRS